MYYIFTSAKKKTVLATKDYNQAYDFITKNLDAKVRTLDFTGKTSILDRRKFLLAFFENTKEEIKMFHLAEIMIKGRTNLNEFLRFNDYSERYKLYKKETENVL